MLITFIVSLFCADSFADDVHVKGYYRADGTYVEPHYRSAPNSTTSDNWSTIGNVNPHTGKIGTKIPNDVIVPDSLPSVSFVPFVPSHPLPEVLPAAMTCQSIVDEWLRRTEEVLGRPPTAEAQALFRAWASTKCETKTSSITTNRSEDFRKFEYCLYLPANNRSVKINDAMKCNAGQELEMKKCLIDKSFNGFVDLFVDLTDASQCWLDAHQ